VDTGQVDKTDYTKISRLKDELKSLQERIARENSVRERALPVKAPEHVPTEVVREVIKEVIFCLQISSQICLQISLLLG
jgi:hypothetical protein